MRKVIVAKWDKLQPAHLIAREVTGTLQRVSNRHTSNFSHYITVRHSISFFGNYLFKQIFHGLCFSQSSLSEKRLPHYRIFTLFRMDIPGSLWYNQLNQKEAFQVCKFKPWYIVTSGVNSVLRLNEDWNKNMDLVSLASQVASLKKAVVACSDT